MEYIGKFITAALLGIFLQNCVFERALGLNILLYASRRRSNVIGFTLGLCYIMMTSSALSWCLDNYFGDSSYYPMFAPVLYVSVIGIIYTVSLIAVWRYFPKLFRQIKKFVHLTVFNCAVIGALFLNTQAGEDIISYIGYGLGTALGFFIAGSLLYVAHERLNSELVPSVFRGMPIMVVYIGVLSMVLHGFTGYVV
ncbi:MAG: hypothetical protein FWG83_01820 [Oscillospiraceae bacterium]|nr:hypothetical protein [Oscillospiraceae bacterium]